MHCIRNSYYELQMHNGDIFFSVVKPIQHAHWTMCFIHSSFCLVRSVCAHFFIIIFHSVGLSSFFFFRYCALFSIIFSRSVCSSVGSLFFFFSFTEQTKVSYFFATSQLPLLLPPFSIDSNYFCLRFDRRQCCRSTSRTQGKKEFDDAFEICSHNWFACRKKRCEKYCLRSLYKPDGSIVDNKIDCLLLNEWFIHIFGSVS